jgi:serine/threonine protein phosphatase PrpC
LIKKGISGFEESWILAVADGHGNNGHLVSKFIKTLLVSKFEFEDKRIMRQKYPHDLSMTSVMCLEKSDSALFLVMMKQILKKTFHSLEKHLENY